MTPKRITTIALALLALTVVAAPAAATAKPPATLHYEGETEGGSDISFALTGKRVSEINGYIMVTCVPTHGVPLSFGDELHLPGSYVLGKSRKASVTEYMSYKGDVAKNYTVDIKPGRKGLWVADIDVNYSYEEVTGSSGLELEQHFYICQGNDSFSFLPGEKPKR